MSRERLITILQIAGGIAGAAIIAAIVYSVIEPTSSLLQLELGDKTIEFLQPSAFYLLAIVPYFFVARRWSLTDVSTAQQFIQAGVRSLVIAGLATALARPAWTTEDNKVATVVLVDVSKSMSDKQLSDALGYAKDLDKAKPDDDKLFVVTFAERPRLIRDWRKLDTFARHTGGGEATDLQSAMQLAYGLYPPGHLPRIVIVSDGNETQGDVLSEAYRAKQFATRVSWKTFPQDRVKEIRVVSLHLPDEIKVGQAFYVTAEVWSTHEEEVKLALFSDEPAGTVVKGGQKVTLTEGVNRVKFKTQTEEAGFKTYRVKLADFKEDTERANNQAIMSTPIRGKPRVLYVEGGRIREPGSSQYLKRALETEHISVDAVPPSGLPKSMDRLKNYDLVLISDVPKYFVDLSHERALETYVRSHGGGLIVSGGQDSFGSGGYQGTTIEKILPVRFDSETQRDQPSVAMALLIDRSGSMSGQKIEAAKEAARATASKLSRSDMISVIAFDSRAIPVVRMQRAANRMRIDNDIARLTASGGTNIYPALKAARDVMYNTRAKVKHVIVLSDGEAPREGIADICEELKSNRVTVSSVGIGGADRSLLEMIANSGGGNHKFVDDLGALPAFFIKETMEKKKQALIEEAVYVHVNKYSDMIKGTNIANAPPLRGYVPTKPKPRIDLVLTSKGQGEPILAHWRVGSGQTAAFTSDLKNRWGVEWVTWGGYGKFWAQVVRSIMRRRVHQAYDLYAQVEDGHAEVVVDAVGLDDRFVNDMDTELQIIDPKTSKTAKTVMMNQTAAGRYVARFPVDRYGSYSLKAVHKKQGKVVAQSVGAVALPYPAEYLKTSIDEKPLRHAALVTGGHHDATAKDAFNKHGESNTYTQDLWPWVLLFTALLMLLDIYFKRLRIFGYRVIKFA